MYPYTYGYVSGFDDGSALLGGVAGFFLVFIILIYLGLFVFYILSYILTGLGLHTIAKRRGLRHAWLSWLPCFGTIWILGSISDQYQYMIKGKTRHRRKTLLGLEIACFAVIIPAYALLVGSTIGLAGSEMGNGTLAGAGFALALLGYVAFIVMAIILSVLYYISLYDLYASCSPSDAAVYVVLSILLSVTMPFLLFSCRKKDLGMQVLHPKYTQQQQPAVLESQAVPVTPAPTAEEPVAEAVVEEPIPEPDVPGTEVEETTATDAPGESIVEETSIETVTEEPPMENTPIEEPPVEEIPVVEGEIVETDPS